MPTTVSITDFRKDIFDLADELYKQGGVLRVTKSPDFVFEFKPVVNDMAERAAYALKYVLPKAGGMWKNKTRKEMAFIRGVRHSAAERKYLERYN